MNTIAQITIINKYLNEVFSIEEKAKWWTKENTAFRKKPIDMIYDGQYSMLLQYVKRTVLS